MKKQKRDIKENRMISDEKKLDAENELLKARLQLIAARKDLYVSKYQMLNLNGNLLESMSIHVSGS